MEDDYGVETFDDKKEKDAGPKDAKKDGAPDEDEYYNETKYDAKPPKKEADGP